MDSMRLVTALFKNKISSEEIPYFRGSIIRLSGNESLFHNHDQDGYHYAYPLIQYKRIGGCAAIVGINAFFLISFLAEPSEAPYEPSPFTL